MILDLSKTKLTGEIIQKLQSIQTHFGQPDISGILEHAREVYEEYQAIPAEIKEEYFKQLTDERSTIIKAITDQIPGAIEAFENSSDAEKAYHVGSLYLQAEDYDNAVIWFKKAIECDRHHAHAHNDLGFAMLRAANFSKHITEEAELMMQKAQNLDPSISDANLSAAADHKLYAQKTSAGEPIDYNHEGILHLHVNRFQEAEKSFRQAVHEDENNAEAHNNLAYSEFRNGDFDQAMESAIKALTLNPKLSPNNLVSISVIMQHTIEYAKSITENA